MGGVVEVGGERETWVEGAHPLREDGRALIVAGAHRVARSEKRIVGTAHLRRKLAPVGRTGLGASRLGLQTQRETEKEREAAGDARADECVDRRDA